MSNIQTNQASIDANKIKSYLQTMNLTTNLTGSEVTQFIEIAQAFGLNPFKREIYASKFGQSFSIIVGFETYVKRAERSGRLSGWHVTTSGSIVDPKSSDIKAIITIHRKDWEHPFVHEVYFREYVQCNREGQVNKFWREKPLTMIKKVAIAQGFRLCFSDELGGMPYTADEINSDIQIVNVPVETKTIEVAKETTPEPAKRGRKPKTQTEPVERHKNDSADQMIFDVLGIIESSQSVDQLKMIYNTYPHFQKNDEFIGALRKKRIELESIEQMQMEAENESEHEHESDDDVIQPNLFN